MFSFGKVFEFSNAVVHFLQSRGEAVFLVTTLTRINSSTPSHVFIRHTLESTTAVLMVTSLVRFGKQVFYEIIIIVRLCHGS